MFIEKNVNPYGANIDDCVIRAISLTLNIPYYDVFDELCELADKLDYTVNSFGVFKVYLDNHGYECRVMEEKMTVKQFSQKFYKGKYLLLVNGHMTTCICGNIYDTWNPSRYKVQFLWVVK